MSVIQSPVDLWPSVSCQEAANVKLGMNFSLLTSPLLVHTVVLVSEFLSAAVIDLKTLDNVVISCSSCWSQKVLKWSASKCLMLYLYVLPNMPKLSDKDECKQAGICGQQSNCNNTIGGFRCTCVTGYKPTDSESPPGSKNLCIGINTAPFPLSSEASNRVGPGSICRLNISVTLCRWRWMSYQYLRW